MNDETGPDRTKCRRGACSWLLAVLALGLAACGDNRGGVLIESTARAPGASTVDMLVATTRRPTDEPGVIFGPQRAIGLNFADIAVSIPPDNARKIGDVQWPSSPPGDPAKDFVTLSVRTFPLEVARADFDARVRATRGHRVLIFVHGYNTRFEEAVYRFAQVTHDSGAEVTPVLFTWPSAGAALGYAYDRESANYSRDALEAVLQAVVKDPNVDQVSVLAHSLGNFVAVEALRQMAIRNHGLSSKIKDIMLAAPDIDVDVFRRQIAEIERDDKAPPVTLFVSQDDHALGISSLIAGNEARLGAVDPESEPYKSLLSRAHVKVVDLTQFAAEDAANHSKFATGDVVRAIGLRLAAGQTLTDNHASLGEAIGGIAIGGANVIGRTTATIAAAPFGGVGDTSPAPATEDAKPLTP